MLKRLSLLLLLTLSVKVSAQNEVIASIYRGLGYSYNFQMQEAESEFQKIISKYPDDPRGYHYKSALYLWAFMGNKDQADFNRFMHLSDIALDKAKNLLDRQDESEDALYVLGANYGLRAMAYTKNNNSLDAVWAAKNSSKYLNRVQELYPYNNDIYLGKGLFSYAVSFVPGVFRWALKIAGFSGSKEEGLYYLKKAFKYGKYSKPEAAFFLSQIYSESYGDYEAAASYLKQLIRQYPRNSLFQYSYAVVLMKDRKPKEAEKTLKDIIRNNNERFQQIIAYSNFLLGDVCFHRNDFQHAVGYYQKFLTSTRDFDYSGIAYFRTALCYEIMKNRQEAMRNYILARNGNLDIPDDLYAKRKGEAYYDKPPLQNEITIIKASNAIEDGRFNEACEVLKGVLPRLENDRLKGEAYQYLSDACYEMGKTDEAIDFASKALRMDTREEKWIKPFACYYGARAYLKSGNKQMASKFLDKAESFGEFDYEAKLEGFVKALRSRL
ncbi:MAG TPA: tetratricopeptide repeat protein [Ignavibacteriales bacterium]|nr:tetratricopeptide repeat protein [Ignavibacteriales bacterium]